MTGLSDCSFKVRRLFVATMLTVMSLLISAAIAASAVRADTLQVLVSPTHLPVMERIAAVFKKKTGHEVILFAEKQVRSTKLPSHTSTLLTSFTLSAPNTASAQALYQSRLSSFRAPETMNFDIEITASPWRTVTAQPGRSVTFAIGQIALWSPDPALIDPKGEILLTRNFDRLAVPGFETGPFGQAAFSVLHKAGVLQQILPQLVESSSVELAYESVRSGAVKLGFIALSEVWRAGELTEGSLWIPPLGWYPAIAMTATLSPDVLGEASRMTLAHQFQRFLLQESVGEILLLHGYLTPAGLVSS